MERLALRNTAPPERAVIFYGYVATVIAAASTIVAITFSDLVDTLRGAPLIFWVIAAVAIVADALPLRTPGRRQTSAVFVSICFTFAIQLMWGLAAAIAIQTAAVVVSSIVLRHRLWRAAFNAGQYAIAFAAANSVLLVAPAVPLRVSPSGAAAPAGLPGVALVLAAAVVWFVVNDLLVTTAVQMRFGGGWWRTFAETFGYESLSTLGLLSLSPVLVAAVRASGWLLPLVAAPMYAVHRLARISRDEQRQSRLDPLTGLANRKGLTVAVGDEIAVHTERARLGVPQHHLGLLLLDLNRFKQINDALGHTVGDRVLVAVGQRLAVVAGPGELVARLGGDEFAILVPDLADSAAARAAATRFADALSAPMVVDGLPLDVGGSLGVAVFPAHGHDFSTLLRHADVAMYDAKHRANVIAIYAPERDHNSPQRLALLADLRRALQNPDSNEITLYYQPQVAIESGEVVGVEALIRWQHPQRGAVDPEELIRIAEHSTVMRLLTLRVMDDALRQAARWRAAGIDLRTALNVSVRDLQTGEIVDRLAARLTQHHLSPASVQLEITEGALMADPRQVLITLQRLDRLGIALALDDFGTGYSSLQHLRRLPLAEVKIDRSFVLGMATNSDDASIVRSIIDLAGSLGLRVVAEGVEDEKTWRMLSAAGCHVAQGWFYARPMPAEEVAPWLARYRPPRLEWPLLPDRSVEGRAAVAIERPAAPSEP